MNRAAKAERDSASSLASDGDRPGPRGVAMDQRERTADLPVLERAEPAGSRRRRGLDPGADRLDHEDVGEARDHGLAAGLEFPASAAISWKTPCIQLGPGPVGGVDVDHLRQDPDQVARDRVVEAHRSADQVVGAPPPPWRMIS